MTKDLSKNKEAPTYVEKPDDPNHSKMLKLHGTLESELEIYGMASALSIAELALEGKVPNKEALHPQSENKALKAQSKKIIKKLNVHLTKFSDIDD